MKPWTKNGTMTAKELRQQIKDLGPPPKVIFMASDILEALDDAAIPRWRPIETVPDYKIVLIRIEGPFGGAFSVQAIKMSDGSWSMKGRRLEPHYRVTHWYPVHPELDALEDSEQPQGPPTQDPVMGLRQPSYVQGRNGMKRHHQE